MSDDGKIQISIPVSEMFVEERKKSSQEAAVPLERDSLLVAAVRKTSQVR